MMPSFNKLTETQRKALVSFLFGNEKVEAGLDSNKPVSDTSLDPYRISGYTKFLDKNGFPAVRPPWGTLNAIDLNTGDYKWKVTFGEVPEAQIPGSPPTGSESYGGPIVTKSGLLFIAGTKDRKFRAYDKKTGKLLWETKLPAAGFATPATYSVKGKQYVVIACGGTKIGATGGDSYVAFGLPGKNKR
jgi:quinoprotein glucose dehydrogenase